MARFCNMKPFLCDNCAYVSCEDASIKFCNMCRITEQMKEYDVDEETVREDDRNSHSVELVASVSFDRQKRQFNYDKFDTSKFDAGQSYDHIKAVQDSAVNAATARFKEADSIRSGISGNLSMKKGLSLI